MKKVIRHLVLGFWSLLVLIPLWVMLVNSFKRRLDIYDNPFALPSPWNFKSYATVFQDSNFLIYFANSLFVTITSLLILLMVGSLASYAIVRWKGRLSHALYCIFIAGMLLPIRIASIDLLNIIRGLGLLDTIYSLLPIYIAMGIPIAIFILSEFIRRIPAELMDSARIDGANSFGIYYAIILPLLRPAIASVAIFNLVPYWNDLWFPLIFINSEGAKTIILGVTRLFGQYQTDWSKILALLSLSVIPVLFLYLMMSKQFIKGLTAGAVKG